MSEKIRAEKLELISSLREESRTVYGQNLLKFLDLRVNELRKLNDVAAEYEFKQNQGAILELLTLESLLFGLK